MDPASCLLSLYRHAPFLTAHAPVGYLSNLATSHHHLTNSQGRVCTRPPGSCKHGLAGNSLRSLAARFTRKPTAVHTREAFMSLYVLAAVGLGAFSTVAAFIIGSKFG